MRIVALEEAFWVDGLQTPGSFVAQHPPLKPDALQDYASRLIDFTAYRLPDMERCGTDVQVLSLTSPGVQMQTDATAAVEVRRPLTTSSRRSWVSILAGTPDCCASAAGSSTSRRGATARSPRPWAVGCARQRPLVGPSARRGPIRGGVAELQSLGVPLYIHPGAPQPWPVLDGYPELNGAPFGWGATTGGHVMRLIYGGIFDRFPGATVIRATWAISAISADPFRLPPSRPRNPRAGPPTGAVLRHQREDHDVGGLLARRAVGRNRCCRRRERHVRRRLSL